MINEIVDVMNLGTDFYSPIMAVINYVCFVSLVVCCLYVYWAATIGQISKGYKQAAVVALLWICILIGLQVYLTSTFGITLIVPPINTPFFTEFMHVIQFLATIAVVLLGAIIFILALLKNLSSEYGKQMVSAIIFLIILISIHSVLVSEFGVPLIFPPNLWR